MGYSASTPQDWGELGPRRDCAGGGNGARVRPGRQEFDQDRQNDKRKDEERDRGQESFARGKGHLISGVAEETFGKKLAADDDIPAHGKNADDGQAPGERIDSLAGRVGQLPNLGETEKRDRGDRADENLNDDL